MCDNTKKCGLTPLDRRNSCNTDCGCTTKVLSNLGIRHTLHPLVVMKFSTTRVPCRLFVFGEAATVSALLEKFVSHPGTATARACAFASVVLALARAVVHAAALSTDWQFFVGSRGLARCAHLFGEDLV